MLGRRSPDTPITAKTDSSKIFKHLYNCLFLLSSSWFLVTDVLLDDSCDCCCEVRSASSSVPFIVIITVILLEDICRSCDCCCSVRSMFSSPFIVINGSWQMHSTINVLVKTWIVIVHQLWGRKANRWTGVRIDNCCFTYQNHWYMSCYLTVVERFTESCCISCVLSIYSNLLCNGWVAEVLKPCKLEYRVDAVFRGITFQLHAVQWCSEFSIYHDFVHESWFQNRSLYRPTTSAVEKATQYSVELL